MAFFRTRQLDAGVDLAVGQRGVQRGDKKGASLAKRSLIFNYFARRNDVRHR